MPFPAGIVMHGYMLWVAIGYSLLGSWIAHRLGRPLVALNGEQQQVEADFRHALVQLREHAEAIALARGEAREAGRLRDRFHAVRANWAALIRTTKRLTWYSAGYGQLANVFPILAAAPRYFSGAIQLGGLMQTAQAFGQVQGALSWFIDAYPRLAQWRATVRRLAAVRNAGLSRYTDRLGEAARWSAVLSPGEQQRVHFARVLLHRPDWVVFDESSSALDEAGERELYRAVREHCPATTVLSVGHRSSLRPLHDREWSLREGDAGSSKPTALPTAATA